MATLPGPGAGLRLGLLPGDGIGPEITPAAARVMDAAMAPVGAPPIEWYELPMGLTEIGSHCSPLPGETVAALERLDGWVLGPSTASRTPSRLAHSWHPAVPCASTSTCTPTSALLALSGPAASSSPISTW